MQQHKLAISHAGGLAAGAILEKLPESGVTPDSLVLLDDESRVGAKLEYAGSYLSILNQHEFDFSKCTMLLMPQADEDLGRQALAQGCFLVSHAIQRDAPVIFIGNARQPPEIAYSETSLRLAGPELSCLLPVLIELNQFEPILRLNTTFLHSAEFHGKAGVDELATQTINLLNARDAKPEVFSDQIAFNLLTEPSDFHIGRDLNYILGNNAFSLIQQSINVPSFHGFTAAIQVEFATELNIEAIKRVLSSVDKVIIKNQPISIISDCNQSFSCVISHLEQAPNQPSMLQFWMMADPMRYGLANNYGKVTEFLLKSFL